MLKGFAHLPRLSPPVLTSRIIKCRMSSVPINPKFVAVEDGDGNARGVVDGSRFRLVSYNILAQVYVKSSYFPYSPASCLKWKARSQAVLEDLRKFDADFLCIQELDEYDSFYRSKMEAAGYSSIYVQRNGKKRDGCGIFYKNKSAKLVLLEEIDYNDLVPSVEHESTSTGSDNNDNRDLKKTSDSDRGDPNDPRVRLKRDCVGILAAFKLNNPSQHIVIVANTHIYWDPEWIDVKLAQVKYLVLRLTRFAELVADKFSYLPSIIVAGDFNSTPGDKVYQYLTSTTNSAGTDSSILPYKLCSLYATNGGEPQFTNYTPGFTGTLDYIFLSNTSSLKPVKIQVFIFAKVEEFEHLKLTISDVARKYKSKAMFVYVDSSEDNLAKPFLTLFGLEAEQPIVTAFDNRIGSKYLLESDLTISNLEEFCSNILRGTLSPYYKSEPIPEADMSKLVEKIVGRTFDASVLNSPHNIFLEVSTPWCMDCEATSRQVEKLAIHFKEEKNLKFARIDASLNEHPKLHINNFPTLLFYPAEDKLNPITLSKKSTLKELATFIRRKMKEHASRLVSESIDDQMKDEL